MCLNLCANVHTAGKKVGNFLRGFCRDTVSTPLKILSFSIENIIIDIEYKLPIYK
jgi:hypothetical protein